MARRRTFCLKIVDDTLKKVFFKLGACVGRQPGYFLIVPALLTALCASGFQRLDYNYDPEDLISPSSGPAKQERAVMEEFFPVNYDFFQVCINNYLWKTFLFTEQKMLSKLVAGFKFQNNLLV